MENKERKSRILIIGGGRRGLATIEILAEDESIEITAVVDVNPNAVGMKLARQLGIKTDSVWEKYLDTHYPHPPDAVLNLTNDTEIQKILDKKVYGKGIEVMGEATQKVLSCLLVERQVQVELHRVSKRIASNINLDELMVLILSSCIKSTKSAGGIIVLFNEASSEWQVKSNWGIPEEIENILFDKASKKLPHWLKKDEVLPLVEDNDSKNLPPEVETALCAPLMWRGEVMGAIIISNRDAGKHFSSGSRQLLATFANQSAVAIENILLYKKSQVLSITDGLTGVFNHRYFQEQLEVELSRAQRYDLHFSIIIVDLDNFKDVNDTYGHLKGDEVLRKVALFIKKIVRESDIVARYGGDEFVVLLPETTKEGALIVGERIRKGIHSKKIADEFTIYASVGLATYPNDGVYGRDLVKCADNALYKAKADGRNKTCAA